MTGGISGTPYGSRGEWRASGGRNNRRRVRTHGRRSANASDPAECGRCPDPRQRRVLSGVPACRRDVSWTSRSPPHPPSASATRGIRSTLIRSARRKAWARS
jgi:ribosomal protein L37AE/L43A